MAAPKGNQYAVGAKNGRPGRDYASLAIDLVEWSKKQYSLSLVQWLQKNNLYYSDLCEQSKLSDDFRKAVQEAKLNISMNRELSVGQVGGIHPTVYGRTCHTYDRIVYDHWKEEKAFEKELESQILSNQNFTVTLVQKPWIDENNSNSTQIPLQEIPNSDMGSP
jgi:hypothetical protein